MVVSVGTRVEKFTCFLLIRLVILMMKYKHAEALAIRLVVASKLDA